MPEGRETNIAGASRSNLVAAALFGIATLLLYYQTTWSMVAIWLRSDTFAHGFLILPISLWLVWVRRQQLQGLASRPSLWILWLTVPPGFVWLLAWLVDVLVVQQLAMVAVLILGISAILGYSLSRALAFPLLFLFFAVPMGEALIKPMMEFTATSTVWLIRQTGIPVYREGLYFTLPSGNWSIVEACSGVRYIIASVTLGVLYAYLTYRSLWRRALFVLVSAVVPIFANTLRAYIIVMLGHYSDMKIATGVDHLIYGWVFFGVVIFVMFWLGSYFREDTAPAAPESAQGGKTGESASAMAIARTTLAALLVVAIWPALALWSDRHAAGNPASPELPVAGGSWQQEQRVAWAWQPFSAVDGGTSGYYTNGENSLGLYLQYAAGPLDDGEVVGSGERFLPVDSRMRVIARAGVELQPGNSQVLANQAHIVGTGAQFLAWSWYRIGDSSTANDYIAKFLEAWSRLGFGSSGVYRIVIVMPLRESPESTRAVLDDFLDHYGARLEQELDDAAGRR